MKWADFCISKLSKTTNGYIEQIMVHDDFEDKIGTGYARDRLWLIQKDREGNTFCTITKDNRGLWRKLDQLTYNDGKFWWGTKLPKSDPRRKAFLSFYHHDDEKYRETFDNLFSDLVVSKSVNAGDISSDTSDDYMKHLIQDGHLADSSILIVLIGPKTKCRKHVDWEISGALNFKVGNRYSALLGLKLPSHPNFGTGKYTPNLLPARLADNLKSKYAVIRDWTEDRVLLQSYLKLAISQRDSGNGQRDNFRLQMKSNTRS